MKLFPNYSKNTQIRIGVIVFFLVIISSAGMFHWFNNSTDWEDIKALILTSDKLSHYDGNIREVSLSYFGYSYKSSGSWAIADFNVDVSNSDIAESFNVVAERKKWKWKLISISKK